MLEWDIERDAYGECESAIILYYCPSMAGGIDLVDIFLVARVEQDYDDNTKWKLSIRQSAYLDGSGTEYHYGDFDFEHIRFNSAEEAKNTAEIVSAVVTTMVKFKSDPTGE